MTITKLSIANGCLRILKEGSLTQNELTNNTREPARLFNAVWDDGGLDACLQAGEWRFARRSIMLDAAPSSPPAFGFTYAFDKPSDFVRVAGVWSDENMTNPLATYREEAGFWFANQETIYLTYVSNDASYGLDYSLWPHNFLKFVQAHFASEIAGPLSSTGSEVLKLRAHFLREALSTDGQADPSRQLPIGSWVRARMSGQSRNRRDN